MRLSLNARVSGLFVIGLVALSMSGMISIIQAQKKQAPTAGPKIIECIKNGDVACTSEFLATGGQAKAVDEKGSPLLITASEMKSATVVRLLLNAGADPNDARSGETPLCRAALFGRKEIAQALLDAGAKADVICDGDHGDSALMTAIRGAMFGEMPFELRETIFNPEELQESADDEKEAREKVGQLREIRAASTDNYLEIARMLLARGVDVNVVAKCDAGESALMYALMAANVEMVKTLLAHGADVAKESPLLDMWSETELEFSRAKLMLLPALSRQQAAMLDWTEKTKARRQEIIQLLKAAGAKEREQPKEIEYSKEVVEDAARESLDDVIELGDLKDFERLVAAYTKHPLGAVVLPNALRVSVIYSRLEMVKLLLERGVNPNTPSTAVGDTPLMQAGANLELVKLLIDAGADINAEDKDGRTALDFAEMYTHSSEGYRTVVAFLKERGALNGKKKK